MDRAGSLQELSQARHFARQSRFPATPRIAILIPCHNEASTIGNMVHELRRTLPGAEILVCDNNSTDSTVAVARKAGATVISERRKGKGNAVRRLFSEVEADVYVMLDGDATYDIPSLPGLIDTLRSERLAMVVGKRQSTATSAFRQGHRFGNYVITRMLGVLFGTEFDDVLSGYRVFNRSFVKSFPIHARGFTIETALTVHALQLRLPCTEIDTPYHARPEGSSSKLSTWRDGLRICLYICHLFVTERPFACFGIGAGITALIALLMFVPILLSFVATGTVERVPTLIVIGSMMVAAIFAFGAGMILQAVTKARQEAKHLAYLNS